MAFELRSAWCSGFDVRALLLETERARYFLKSDPQKALRRTASTVPFPTDWLRETAFSSE